MLGGPWSILEVGSVVLRWMVFGGISVAGRVGRDVLLCMFLFLFLLHLAGLASNLVICCLNLLLVLMCGLCITVICDALFLFVGCGHGVLMFSVVSV